MQWRWPEFIPGKKWLIQETIIKDHAKLIWDLPRRVRLIKQTQKRVAKKIDCTTLINYWITGLPRCFDWMEYPTHENSLSIVTAIMEKELLIEPLYITISDNIWRVQSYIHLQKNPSWSYNINFAQCQFSRAWILGMMQILDNLQKYNISEDCPNYISLFEFFENIDIDERLITGMEWLVYKGQQPSEKYI